MSVTLTIDGRELTVPEGTTLFDAAREAGIEIPTLCHDPKLEPVGVCRMCVVEVEGSRVMAASCVRRAEPGMVVRTSTEKVERCRSVLTFSSTSGINSCPPNPGCTLITSTRSTSSRTSKIISAGVSGFTDTPTLTPSERICLAVAVMSEAHSA